MEGVYYCISSLKRVTNLFKKAFDSVRREVLYNILTEFGVSTKPIRLIKMCLNETYSKAHIGKHLSELILYDAVNRNKVSIH
jgi:hypothetical protein